MDSNAHTKVLHTNRIHYYYCHTIIRGVHCSEQPQTVHVYSQFVVVGWPQTELLNSYFVVVGWPHVMVHVSPVLHAVAVPRVA